MKYCNITYILTNTGAIITHFKISEQISEHYFGNQSKRREIIEYIFH